MASVIRAFAAPSKAITRRGIVLNAASIGAINLESHPANAGAIGL